MANTIKIRRSATQGATPTTQQLSLGELAINTHDGKLFLKKDVSGTESIVEVGGATDIGSLSDVTVASVSDGQFLQYNATNSSWENTTFVSGGTAATIIAPFAHAYVDTASAGSGTNISWGTWASNNGEVDFTFATTQANTDYSVVTDNEWADDIHAQVINKSTTGFTLILYSDAQNESPASKPVSVFVYAPDPTVTIGGTGAANLNDLADVSAGSPTNGQILQYNTTTSAWEPGAAPAGNTDLTYTSSTRVLASSTGSDATIPEVVADGDSGLMTGADKTKLDGIATGAEANVATDLTYDSATRVLASSTGTDATIPEVVAGGDSGLMTGSDKTKLDGLQSGSATPSTSVISAAEHAKHASSARDLSIGLYAENAFFDNNQTVDNIHFGWYSKLSGDGTLAVVSAYFADNGAPDSFGRVWVCSVTPSGLEVIFELPNPNSSNTYTTFGSSLAINGNGNTIVASYNSGSFGSTNNFAIFERDGSSNVWNQVATYSSPNGQFWFARSVAISDDGEIVTTGCQNEDRNGGGLGQPSNVGALWVVRKVNGSWPASLTQLPDWSPLVNESLAGRSVAISGDGNTIATVYNPTGAYPQLAQVLIYRYDGNTWKIEQNTGLSSNVQWNNATIQISYDGQRIAVGAMHTVNPNDTYKHGSVNILQANNSGTYDVLYGGEFTPSTLLSVARHHFMGEGICLSEDGRTLAVSARKDANGLPDRVFVLQLNEDTIEVIQEISGPANTVTAFGISVDYSSDKEYLLIGDNYAASAANLAANIKTGAVYLYRLNRTQVTYLNSTGKLGINQSSPQYALDVLGDINFTGTLYKNGVVFSSGGGGGGGGLTDADYGDITVSGSGTAMSIDDGVVTTPKLNLLYADQTAFPAAGSNHGNIAHSHSDGAMFFAHSSAWVELANADLSNVSLSVSVSSLTEVSGASPNDGDVIQYNSTNSAWEVASAPASGITVKQTQGDGGTVDLTATSVTEIVFDTNSGFSVTDNTGSVFVSLGSSFKTWYVSGETTLVAEGEDEIEIIAGSGITLATTTTGTGSATKALTITSTATDGTDGADGAAATIQVGTVTTLAAGSSATITNSGTTAAAVFDFGIPAGAAGTPGTDGTDGTDGVDGTNATIQIGTVTTGAAGSSAAVSNSGTASAAVLDFTIPQGAAGTPGTDGSDGVDGTAATIQVGTVTTGASGTSATVTNSGTTNAAVLNFTIPKGDEGPATVQVGTVTTGAAGSSAAVSNSGSQSAAVFDFTIPRGDAGQDGTDGTDGADATVSVGTVTTGAAGSSAAVTNVGTPGAAVFNFTIPKGDQGTPGTNGTDGIDGTDGTDGAAATIQVGTVTTGAAGSSASVSNSGTTNAAVLNFTIPRGDEGPATVQVGTVTTGAAGTGAAVSNSGTQSAAVFDFTIPRGDAGQDGTDGTDATVSVGTVTTGAAGSSASVTNSGTSGAAVFNFTIPKGDQGDPGTDGSNGIDGSAATISIGTITTGAAGSSANVSNSGTSNAAVLDFTIPKGDDGAATVSIGTVTTGNAGSSATVTNTGSQTAAVLDFTIPKGDQGNPGASSTITVGNVTTGAAGSNAAVSNSGTASAAVLDFTIPRGADGNPGSPGSAATIQIGTVTTLSGGSSATVTNSGTSSAAVLDFGIPQGPDGTATITIGTVTTGAAGTNASVTNSGTNTAAVLDFTIPRGDTGTGGGGGGGGVDDSTAIAYAIALS